MQEAARKGGGREDITVGTVGIERWRKSITRLVECFSSLWQISSGTAAFPPTINFSITEMSKKGSKTHQ